MKCPKCVGKLTPAKINLFFSYQSGELKGEGVTEELALDQCFLCGGVWFDKGELEKYLKEGVKIIGASDETGVVSREFNLKVGKCPRCEIEMKKEKAPKDPSVTMDRCEKCGGVWLDEVEVDKLERASVPAIERFVKKLVGRFQQMNLKPKR